MPLTYADKIIEVARRHLHVREQGGTNRGLEVEQFLASVHAAPGNAWCAAFVHFVCMTAAKELGGKTNCKPSGAVSSQWTKARLDRFAVTLRDGQPVPTVEHSYLVKPGDVWCRVAKKEDLPEVRDLGARRLCHTGIVVAVSPKSFSTIEGNTNGAGSRDGDGVYAKTQKWDDPRTIGFWRPSLITRTT